MRFLEAQCPSSTVLGSNAVCYSIPRAAYCRAAALYFFAPVLGIYKNFCNECAHQPPRDIRQKGIVRIMFLADIYAVANAIIAFCRTHHLTGQLLAQDLPINNPRPR